MKRILLFTIFCLLITLQGAMAQTTEIKDGLAVRAVFPNYQWPISNKFLESDFTSGMEIEYIRNLNSLLNVSFPFRITKAGLPLDENGKTTQSGILGLDALLHLKFMEKPSFFYPHIYAGVSGYLEDLETVNFGVPLGLGLNFRIGRNTYLSTKGEYRIGFEDLRDHIQLDAGLLFLLGDAPAAAPPKISDRDGDGVSDEQDLCPDVFGLAGLNGCPDKDGDGVTDGDDACPDVAGLAALGGCPDTDGDGIADKDDDCPTEKGTAANRGCPVRDADGDGVPDSTDECPNQAGPAATNGCPDRDGDGVADKNDDCPDVKGPAATRGCPDSDGDGVLDRNDKCPNTAGPASNNGCPEIKKEDKEVLDLAMRAVQFETAKATFLPASFNVLNQIADIMNRYPDYKLSIGGHTDSIGSAEDNQKLSEKRAKACYDYLITKGVAAGRLTWAGFGESKPIGDNRYKDGREKNRRVEFQLYVE
ncbi:MAG TPA: OmpA family protein [Flavilitoribacter sp.]|nr:OmpA family protein [Flavilitoribacter sp.]